MRQTTDHLDWKTLAAGRPPPRRRRRTAAAPAAEPLPSFEAGDAVEVFDFGKQGRVAHVMARTDEHARLVYADAKTELVCIADTLILPLGSSNSSIHGWSPTSPSHLRPRDAQAAAARRAAVRRRRTTTTRRPTAASCRRRVAGWPRHRRRPRPGRAAGGLRARSLWRRRRHDLSNCAATFTWGLRWPSAEHAYQAIAKCDYDDWHRFAINGDLSSLHTGMRRMFRGREAEKIKANESTDARPTLVGAVAKTAVTPACARALGLRLLPAAERGADHYMLLKEILEAKYRQNALERAALLATGDKLLVELSRTARTKTGAGHAKVDRRGRAQHAVRQQPAEPAADGRAPRAAEEDR